MSQGNPPLVSSKVSFTTWEELPFLMLIVNPSQDGVTIKIHYGVDILLYQPNLLPTFLYLMIWLKPNLYHLIS